MTKNKNISGLPALLPILAWLWVIGYYSVDVPWYDDFDPFPDFLRHWIEQKNWSERLGLLLQPNNEHRMVIGKLMVLLYYGLTGELSFTFLHFAGAAFTLGTCYLFWLSFKNLQLKWWYFLPVILLLFQLEHHLVYLWAICSLQHQPVVFFLCLSMYLLSKDRLVGAILAAICANYAMSNGIFVWVAGGAVLFLHSDYKKLVVWLLAAGISIYLYFYGLSTMGNEASLIYLKEYPHLSILGFFAFLGGLFDLFPNQIIQIRTALPILMGFLIMIWISRWGWAILRRWFEQNFKSKNSNQLPGLPLTSFLLGIMVFLLANALVIGLLRPRFGFFVMVVSNYKIYPALFLMVAYLSLLSGPATLVWRKRGMILSFVLSIFIWALSYYSYLPEISERSKYLTVNGWNQKHNGFGLGHVPYSEGAAYVDTLMKQMVAQQIYSYPSATDRVANAAATIVQPLPASIDIKLVERPAELLLTESNQVYDLAKDHGQYVFLRNKDKTFLFKMNQNLYQGRNPLRIYDRGLFLTIPLENMLPGEYEVGYLDLEGTHAEGGILRRIIIPNRN
ncbi:hypothetical protein [Dyadobacter tibetensis]|uniref:hypothetical protein n=1 Tax=Dyadobacter tibetensis TaxID=1211851 RepID=UPI0004ADB3E6|nr:hypothetical protein [Dyadobacter tibetensis]